MEQEGETVLEQLFNRSIRRRSHLPVTGFGESLTLSLGEIQILRDRLQALPSRHEFRHTAPSRIIRDELVSG